MRGNRRKKIRDLAQHPLRLLPMRNVPTRLENHCASRPLCQTRDSVRVLDRAELVPVAMERKRWAMHSAQFLIEPPGSHAGVKPRVNPCIENPARLLAVIPRQALELARSLELGLSGAN